MDLFSSIYGVDYPLDFVYTNKSIDTSTFVPKYNYLYRRILEEKIKDRRPIGIDFTIDGLAFLFGEDNFIKLFQNLIALKEKARITEKRKRPINIFLFEQGQSLREVDCLDCPLQSVRHRILLFLEDIQGKMVIRKSPLPDFKPKEGGYDFWIGEGQVHIE